MLVWTQGCRSFQQNALISLDIFPDVKLLDNMVVQFCFFCVWEILGPFLCPIWPNVRPFLRFITHSSMLLFFLKVCGLILVLLHKNTCEKKRKKAVICPNWKKNTCQSSLISTSIKTKLLIIFLSIFCRWIKRKL